MVDGDGDGDGDDAGDGDGDGDGGDGDSGDGDGGGDDGDDGDVMAIIWWRYLVVIVGSDGSWFIVVVDGDGWWCYHDCAHGSSMVAQFSAFLYEILQWLYRNNFWIRNFMI